jgi:hypothetical protein
MLVLMGCVRRENNSRRQTRNSRWSSEGSRLFQGERETETEHRLSRWIPIRAGKRSLLCCTKLSSFQVDLAKRGGYPTKIPGLYPDSQRGSDWLHKRSNLWVSHRNEAQGRKNWGKKGVARRYRKPEKTPRKTRLPKEELINRAVKLADAVLKLMGGRSLPSDQRHRRRCAKTPPSGILNRDLGGRI